MLKVPTPKLLSSSIDFCCDLTTIDFVVVGTISDFTATAIVVSWIMAACNSSGDTGEVGSSISSSISPMVNRKKNRFDTFLYENLVEIGIEFRNWQFFEIF